MKCTGRIFAGRRLALALLAAALPSAAGVAAAAEPKRYGYCTWTSRAPGLEAVVSTVYTVPAGSGSLRLARSFAAYLNAGQRDRPRPFAPVCFSEFESEGSARQQRNRELAGYRERGFTLQVVGEWQPEGP